MLRPRVGLPGPTSERWRHLRQADLDARGGHALRDGARRGAQERAPALAQQLQQRLAPQGPSRRSARSLLAWRLRVKLPRTQHASE
jgi:hypothetical protein